MNSSRKNFTNKKTSRRYAKKSAPYTKQSKTKLSFAAQRLEQLESILKEVLVFDFPADTVLSGFFRKERHLGARDRKELAEGMYQVLRHLKLYRHLAQSGSGSTYRRLAILGLKNTIGSTEEVQLKEVLNQDEIAWLQHLDTLDYSSLDWTIRYSVPDWLVSEFAQFSNKEELLEALNQQASFDLRVNPLKFKRDEFIKYLNNQVKDKVEFSSTPFSSYGVRLADHPNISQWDIYKEGKIEVQDEGSQLLCLAVAPKRHDLVIDFCAGAGGKTLLLGALMHSKGRLYAFDIAEKRLARAKQRLARSGLSNATTVVLESENDNRVKRLANKADRVLIDAPCTGSGTLRRNPDIKWRHNIQRLDELIDTQKRILQSASRCVKSGGRLIYATCSLLAQENEQQIEDFLKLNKQFELIDINSILPEDKVENLQSKGPYLKLRPDIHNTDGFFAAVLQKK